MQTFDRKKESRYRILLPNKKESGPLCLLSCFIYVSLKPYCNGSNGARTHDLSRVRRTLIPAELCFHAFIIAPGTKNARASFRQAAWQRFAPNNHSLLRLRMHPDFYCSYCLQTESCVFLRAVHICICFRRLRCHRTKIVRPRTAAA